MRVRRKGHKLREQLTEQEFWELLLVPEYQVFPSTEARRYKFGLLIAELERLGDSENAARARDALQGIFHTPKDLGTPPQLVDRRFQGEGKIK